MCVMVKPGYESGGSGAQGMGKGRKNKSTHGGDFGRQFVPFAIEERPVFVRFQHVFKEPLSGNGPGAGNWSFLTSWLVAVLVSGQAGKRRGIDAWPPEGLGARTSGVSIL
jgi:hypothetical protein